MIPVGRINTDLLFPFLIPLKFDNAADFGKNRVVGAEAYVQSRHKFSPSLSHDDRASRNEFPSERLDAEPLACAIPSVCS